MSISSQFLWRFLDDVWDMLPSPNRELFEAYWQGQLQIAGNLEQRAIEAALSTNIADVPVYLTQRWNRFVMNDDSCDLFAGSELVQLIGIGSTSLQHDTVFYHTLRVSTATGQIRHIETMQFFDGSVRRLRYGKIINGMISVRIGAMEYTPNRDYIVNLARGEIQALESGRIPIDEVATITYYHEDYTLDLDYEVDESRNTLRRTAGSTVADGDTVTAYYTYNTTATLLLVGANGAVDGSILTDESKDFSSLLPLRTLTITGGPNAGIYSINSAISSSQIQIVEAFPSTQEGEVPYTIDAFPHGQRVDKRIVSLPVLQDRINAPTHVLEEGVDFRVQDGILASRVAFRLSEFGESSTREPVMWAEKTSINDETPYRNFGVLIDFYRTNSEAYKLALQGLWYTFWTGSTPGNLERGLHILLGLPYARTAGTVTRLDTASGTIEITGEKSRIISYTIPGSLTAVVAVGDEIERFAKLTTGVQIIDRNNEPGFVAARLGRGGINHYLTSNASQGPGDTDETKALTLLENHLFLPQILVEALSSLINVQEFTTFLDNMKPQWTDYIFSFASEESEDLELSGDPVESGEWVNTSPGEVVLQDLEIDLTATVFNNEWNQSFSWDSFLIDRLSGRIPSGSTQATGNFRDPFVNFATLGVDRNDTVQILAGAFQGYWRVLARINNTTLSLNIPDADIVGTTNIAYRVIPEERNLGHDAVQLKLENIVLPGTEFLAPSTLNTKTDVDFLELEDEDILSLLLVDISNVGNEVQAITSADIANGEIDVAAAPTPAVQDHEIASAALKRRNNGTATVTHVYAI